MTDIPAMLEALGALHPKAIDLSLDRVHNLLTKLDSPQDRLPPVIHVAGTNGKGSAIAFLRAMLEAAGHRVHVYTSPHLVRFNERIRIGDPEGGQLIDDLELADAITRARDMNAGDAITYFEITTAIALDVFARHPADYCLLEVGLGGRFDATNVVEHPLAAVISPIAHDHEDYLGESLAGIASEKAGILKPGAPAVLGPQDAHVMALLELECEALGIVPYVHGQDWTAQVDHGRLVFQDEMALLDLPIPRMRGIHQAANAGLAIAALRAGNIQLVSRDIEAGIISARWPARLQRLRQGDITDLAPLGTEIWVDAGHNPSAAAAVAAAIAELEERSPKPLVIIAALADTKDSIGFFRAFDGLARHAWTVPLPNGQNEIPPDTLAQDAIEANIPAFPAANFRKALAGLYDHFVTGDAPRVLICGSHLLAGAVLAENGETPT